jgi:hypothetical protein
MTMISSAATINIGVESRMFSRLKSLKKMFLVAMSFRIFLMEDFGVLRKI